MQTGVNCTTQTYVALHSAQADSAIALCAAVDFAAEGDVPEWVHLLPAGEIRTGDRRGPYTVRNAEQLIANSIGADGVPLILDENHSTDLAAPKGGPAPARGWIKALQARQDGIWGQVDWTPEGRAMVAGKAYRGISPVIEHLKDFSVTAIRRASLVNKPNLRGLTALHQETPMDLLAQLIAALKLEATTSEAALVAAVTALHQQQADTTVALQAQLAPIAKAAGLADDAGADTVVTTIAGLVTAGAGSRDAVVTALQAELAKVTTSLNTLTETGARDKATAFVDRAIEARTVGVGPLRDHYIAMHMENSARVEKEIGALPKLNGSHTGLIPPKDTSGAAQLTPAQKTITALMGVSEADYLKTLAAEGAGEAAL